MSTPQPSADGLPLSAPIAGLARVERYLSISLIFGFLAVAIFFMAWNRGIAMLYALFAVLAGAGLISLIGARLMLRRATLHFQLPQRFHLKMLTAVGKFPNSNLNAKSRA